VLKIIRGKEVWKTNNNLIFVVFLFLIVILIGCIDGRDNQTLSTFPKTKNYENYVGGNTIDNSSIVVGSEKHATSIAPFLGYINVNETKYIKYRNKEIKISFISNGKVKRVNVTIGESCSKEIKIGNRVDGRGIYFTFCGMHFSIKPVEWVKRENELIPFYEKSWNTTQIFVKIVEVKN